MFYRLGAIFSAMKKNEDIIIHLINEFTKEFPQERDFKSHFKNIWCHGDGHIGKIAKFLLLVSVLLSFKFIYVFLKCNDVRL